MDAGAQASYHVDDVSHASVAWLDGVSSVGVTSGASVPDELVADVLTLLADNGFSGVVEVTAAEEHLVFALPPELRRELRTSSVPSS